MYGRTVDGHRCLRIRRAACLVLYLTRRLLHVFGRNHVFTCEVSRQQQPIAYGVYAARNTIGCFEDRLVCSGFEAWVVLPADMRQPVLDVCARLVAIERPDVAARDD